VSRGSFGVAQDRGAERGGELHTRNHQKTEAGIATMLASVVVGLLRGPSPPLSAAPRDTRLPLAKRRFHGLAENGRKIRTGASEEAPVWDSLWLW
jgi:hypothetical protein